MPTYPQGIMLKHSNYRRQNPNNQFSRPRSHPNVPTKFSVDEKDMLNIFGESFYSKSRGCQGSTLHGSDFNVLNRTVTFAEDPVIIGEEEDENISYEYSIISDEEYEEVDDEEEIELVEIFNLEEYMMRHSDPPKLSIFDRVLGKFRRFVTSLRGRFGSIFNKETDLKNSRRRSIYLPTNRSPPTRNNVSRHLHVDTISNSGYLNYWAHINSSLGSFNDGTWEYFALRPLEFCENKPNEFGYRRYDYSPSY